MKILMVDDYGYLLGGAENYLFAISNALRAQGHEVRLLASDKQHGGQADYTFRHVSERSPLRFIPYIFNRSARAATQRAIREFQPDVVHIHSFFYHSSPAILYGLLGTPTVITTHNDDLIAPFGHTLTPACTHDSVKYCWRCIGLFRASCENLKRWFLRRALPRVSLFIGPSAFMADFYRQRGFDASRVVHLKNGFELPPAHAPLMSKRSGMILVARLSVEKGVDVAITAMGEVVTQLPKAQLTVIGDGPDRQKLEQLVHEKRLQKNIIFAGRIDNTQIGNYQRGAEALIIPSVWNENLPTVCIEAMVAGTPIIGSKVGGIPEMVQDGASGFLFPRGDHHELAKCIVTLLSNKPLQQQFSEQAVRLSKEYRMENHLPKLLTFYEQAQERAR